MVTDQFHTLVKSDKEIQPFIQNLTGINNGMLENEPKFSSISKKINEITKNCIMVAHNANFDYRILKNEFNNIGIKFRRKTLCTIEISKQILPKEESYSLGKLAKSLGIDIVNRHRADGDAIATLKLFKILLKLDEENIIEKLIK